MSIIEGDFDCTKITENYPDVSEIFRNFTLDSALDEAIEISNWS